MTFCTCNANPIRVISLGLQQGILESLVLVQVTRHPLLMAVTRHPSVEENKDKRLLTFNAPVSGCDACQADTSVVHRCKYLRQKLLTLRRLLSSALW